MKHPIEKGACYVIHQGFGDIYEMFGGRTDLIMYPENRMNLFERKCGVRYENSIVTESSQLISCYDRRNVFVWENGKWVNPEDQTYGCSYEIIDSNILGFHSSIPYIVLSSDMIEIVYERLKKQYEIN